MAVDILLNRMGVSVSTQDFKNWRIALNGYIEGINEYIEQANK